MKQMKYLILPISLFISGCSYLPFFQNDEPVVPIEIKTIQERPPMWHPPLPIEMNMLDVEFEILTPELMKEYLKLVEIAKDTTLENVKKYTDADFIVSSNLKHININ